ncbi:hypothetical protein Taro_054156 [Colocasia esculenta]|uniref:Aminotransferase-like plant mobile domain-containing protein n=1 Tax=Colocasia esculenta TaxID=4460 RepID=A0A843XPN3_COLES|nr:hypothetical protein [Colocasia esculenta]
MVPTLKDVVRINGLRVDGQAVIGTTYTSYHEPVERLLELEVRGERSSLVGRTALQASLGIASARHRTGEGQAEYLARLTEDARAVLAEAEGEAADRDLRRFLILVIGKLILGTRGDPVGCRCLPLLEDLSSVGNYAWGAALLAHLFDSLGTSSRETGVAGFFPLLQVWAYNHLPSLGRGVARRRSAVPLLQRWRFFRDERCLRRQVTMIHDALDTIPFGHSFGFWVCRYSGPPMSGRVTPHSRGWSEAVPTSVGTFGCIASTRWFRSTTGWWRVLWDSIRRRWSSRPDSELGRGQAGASAGSSRSQTERSRSGSSWRTGSDEGQRWSLRPLAMRTTFGHTPGSTGPRCTRGPDDRLTLRGGSPRLRASSTPPSSSATTSRR